MRQRLKYAACLALLALVFSNCDDTNGPELDLPIAGGVYNDGCLIYGRQLPDSGTGYYHFRGCDTEGSDNWGTQELIDLIEKVGKKWLYRYSWPVRIGILDMSRRDGGVFRTGCRQHKSHQNGLDVDVRYVRSDNLEAAVTIHDATYDRARSKQLFRLFLDLGADVIFTSDGELAGSLSGVKHVPEHANHFHVRLPHPGEVVPCP
jgi:murein endopeptidase